jgi:hypothetical protein
LSCSPMWALRAPGPHPFGEPAPRPRVHGQHRSLTVLGVAHLPRPSACAAGHSARDQLFDVIQELDLRYPSRTLGISFLTLAAAPIAAGSAGSSSGGA